MRTQLRLRPPLELLGGKQHLDRRGDGGASVRAVTELAIDVVTPGVKVAVGTNGVPVAPNPFPAAIAFGVTPAGSETTTGVSVLVVVPLPSA